MDSVRQNHGLVVPTTEHFRSVGIMHEFYSRRIDSVCVSCQCEWCTIFVHIILRICDSLALGHDFNKIILYKVAVTFL